MLTYPDAVSDVSVRQRLPGDAAWAFGLAMVFHTWTAIRENGLGWDARAYFVAWEGPLYEAGPMGTDAYLYSPVFAQIVWPLTLLPWPVFLGLVMLAAGLTCAWLLKPLGARLAVPLWLACLPEVASGNIAWLLALTTVLAFRHGGWWCVPALTKIVPAGGALWHLVRGEWRSVRASIATTLVVVAVSFIAAPGLWQSWFEFLVENAQLDESPGAEHFPSVGVRIVMAAIIIVVAARTDRRWLGPVALVVCYPVLSLGALTLLAAIPRLRAGRTATEADDSSRRAAVLRRRPRLPA